MEELSVFVDESGDFGEYDKTSPYYIVTMVFHKQSINLQHEFQWLAVELQKLGLKGHCVHVGPMIRKEAEYRYMNVAERRKILNKVVAFIRCLDIRFQTFCIQKKQISSKEELSEKLSKIISSFIQSNYDSFLSNDTVKIYYDNGQVELSRVLSRVFSEMLRNAEIKRVEPEKYKLFQVADLFCTFELIRLKMEHESLSKSESLFFGNIRDLKKNYIKPLERKRFAEA